MYRSEGDVTINGSIRVGADKNVLYPDCILYPEIYHFKKHSTN